MSNLPPGVSMNMIPGNRPEDLDEEAFYEALFAKLEERKVPAGALDKLDEYPMTEVVEVARDLGYERGFADGRMEAQIEQALRHTD